MESTASRSRRPTRRTTRERALEALDTARGGLILVLVVFTPWAFGTTQTWSIMAATVGCYSLGLILLAQRLLGARLRGTPSAWLLGFLTCAVLGMVAASVLNARATWDPVTRTLNYLRASVPYLPSTYDREATLDVLAQWVGLAVAFWSIRDWLRRSPPSNRNGGEEESLPRRHRRLLWTLCLSGTALALTGLLQRAGGTSDLLFLLPSRSGKPPEAVFGPWSYRANAAQYFNLLWPACLGFWYWLQEEAYRSPNPAVARFDGPQVLLIPFGVILAAAPIISGSRGAAVVAACQSLACVLLLLSAGHRCPDPRLRRGIKVILGGALIAAAVTGGTLLRQRMSEHPLWHPARFRVGDQPLTLAARVRTPAPGTPGWQTIAALSTHREGWGDRPGTSHLVIGPDGTLYGLIVTTNSPRMHTVVMSNFVDRFPRQEVNVALVRDAGLRLVVNGETVARTEERLSDLIRKAPLSAGLMVTPHPTLMAGAGTFAATDAELTIATNGPPPVFSRITEAAAAQPARGVFLDFTHSLSWNGLRMRLSGRDRIVETSWRIAADYPVWGTGAGTFETLYGLYRDQDEEWAAYAHCDWLEFRLTLGWVGLGLLVTGLCTLGWQSLRPRRLPPARRLLIQLLWTGLAGCLLHAIGDFPFRVYSVFFLFLVLTAVSTALAETEGHAAE